MIPNLKPNFKPHPSTIPFQGLPEGFPQIAGFEFLHNEISSPAPAPTIQQTPSPPAGGVTPGTPVVSGDYCSLGGDHTMCKYQGPKGGCNAKVSGLTPAGKQAILDKHNELRRKVAKGQQGGQPGAANMRKLVWNDELEAIAQRWADQCQFGHDSKRTKLDGTKAGQNVFGGFASQPLSQADVEAKYLTYSTQQWFDEVTMFGGNPSGPYRFGGGTGHYTQIVWAKTDELGCGLVHYKGQGYETNIVCNYAIAGNFAGDMMYKTGQACSQCPDGFTCDDGLCAKA